MTNKIYENCKIKSIEKNDKYQILNITLSAPEHENKEVLVNIRGSRPKTELPKLKEGKIPVAYFDCGMTDIDINKTKDGKYRIYYSPCDGAFEYYVVDESDIDKIIEESFDY